MFVLDKLVLAFRWLLIELKLILLVGYPSWKKKLINQYQILTLEEKKNKNIAITLNSNPIENNFLQLKLILIEKKTFLKIFMITSEKQPKLKTQVTKIKYRSKMLNFFFLCFDIRKFQ